MKDIDRFSIIFNRFFTQQAGLSCGTTGGHKTYPVYCATRVASANHTVQKK